MAKKIRFPLKLAEGAEARTLEELREHFDLQAVLGYYASGKLLTWLEDRYLEGEAEAIRALDEAAPDFQQRLCGVLQVEYAGAGVNMEEVERRQERLKRLRTITDEAEYIQNIYRVAFDQEELADLLDEGLDRIYLCGEKFTIPASRKGVAYVGIKEPSVHISGRVPEDPEELGIQLTGVHCDNLPAPGKPEPVYEEPPAMGELSPEAIRMAAERMIVTDHYALISREEYDEQEGIDVKYWCIYSHVTGEETRLVEEVQEKVEKNVGFDNENVTICGDDLFFIGDDSFIIDLAANQISYLPSNLNHQNIAAFDSNRIVFSDGDKNGDNAVAKCEVISIFNRHTSKIEKTLSLEAEQFLLDGKITLNKNVDFICNAFALAGNNLFFVVNHKKTDRYHLACYNLGTDKFRFITEISFELSCLICHLQLIAHDKYVYLIGSDGRKICAVNLDDRSIRTIDENWSYYEREIVIADGQSTQYLVYLLRKFPENVIKVIELSTGETRKLPCPFRLDDFELAGLFRIFGTNLYCCEYDQCCKYDLTEADPQPVEINISAPD